jgi:hypothetical protein
VVEHLLSKREALSSVSSTTDKQTNKKLKMAWTVETVREVNSDAFANGVNMVGQRKR